MFMYVVTIIIIIIIIIVSLNIFTSVWGTLLVLALLNMKPYGT